MIQVINWLFEYLLHVMLISKLRTQKRPNCIKYEKDQSDHNYEVDSVDSNKGTVFENHPKCHI